MGAAADEHRSASESETASIARALAADLPEGTWILLTGSLGAGKTAFVRGLAEGLGIDPRLVHSPTFTLVSEYRGHHVLAHVDLYRVEQIGEIDELGLDDLREQNLIVAVEWAERLPPGLAQNAITVRIEIVAGEERRIRIARR